MKKSNSTQSEPTMCYDYANQEKEYVFCVKGRPFPCLVSPHLPTPTASLIDYDLVRDTGLKMSDLQCQKFSYAGYKMRILGKVSLTVQCIHDGVSSGTFHLKGNEKKFEKVSKNFYHNKPKVITQRLKSMIHYAFSLFYLWQIVKT